MDKIRLLLVEDEPTLAMIVKETLEDEGFDIITAGDGLEGLEKAVSVSPDIIVADIMMPKMDGFDMVRHIRKNGSQVPVLFLTARSAVEDVVKGFNLGANDYLRKPFSMLELIVRVKALVQRINGVKAMEVNNGAKLHFGLYTLQTDNQRLQFADEAGEELSHRESEVLRLLAQHPNDVVPTHDILLSLWGDDSPYNANSLQVFITKLRHKLSADANVKIINVRGVGYKLVC